MLLGTSVPKWRVPKFVKDKYGNDIVCTTVKVVEKLFYVCKIILAYVTNNASNILGRLVRPRISSCRKSIYYDTPK